MSLSNFFEKGGVAYLRDFLISFALGINDESIFNEINQNIFGILNPLKSAIVLDFASCNFNDAKDNNSFASS